MTEQVEELTRGDALAKVAALEAENAELRKRVCVPDGWMVVPSQCTSQMEDAYDQQCADDNAYGCSMHLPAYEAMLTAVPAPVERLATDGGRNQRFEGLFEGETPDQRDARLASAASVERVERVEREAQSKVARCIGMRPGMGEVTVKVEDGIVSGWLDPGCTVYIYPTTQPAAPAQHSDDVAVDRFAAAMKAKLAAARAKGRSGWDDPSACSIEYLAQLLHAHLRKRNAGTFEDVANFCMMLHQRGADPAALSEAPAPDVAGLEFTLAHPDGEKRTVMMTKDEVQQYMVDEIYEKLGALVCSCEPVGETNVCDCNCIDRIEQFEIAAHQQRGGETCSHC
ncbi:hypothetical protein CNQ84_00775 [Pseudomonas abyssi]|uniref:Uncharacterized protein n=1 Tax=Pseudomonas abyssi TaxID=170540 RepID=A0A2A3MMD4_9PSED|nr:hypothetical protein [Pseudomonas abyssi]PBK05943.1 hypothetical protein CNQ84_00775 [Pseudomonas abyssi]